MRNNNLKTQNTKLPSFEGRADEITSLLDSFFISVTASNAERTLFDVLHEYISPNEVPSNRDISNNLFVFKEISDLIKKLEIIQYQLKGGQPC